MREDVANLIDHAGYAVSKRYRGYTTAEDLRQEMWVWVLQQNPKKLEEADKRLLEWHLRNVGDLHGRKQKAAKEGYVPTDEVFYSISAIRECLPLAIESTPVVLRKEGPNEFTGGKGGIPVPLEFETAIADLRKAYRGLSSKYREVLRGYVSNPEDADEVQVTRALRWMQRKLGGKRPRKGDL